MSKKINFGDMKTKLNGYSESYRAKRADGKSGLSRVTRHNRGKEEEHERVQARPLNQLSDPKKWAPPPKRGDPPVAPPRQQEAAPAPATYAQPAQPGVPIAGQQQAYYQPAQGYAPADPNAAYQQGVQYTYPTQAVQPGQPVPPAAAGAPQPGQPVYPAYAAQPGQPGQPGQPAQPAQPVQPAQPAYPGYTQPALPAQPAQPGQPVQPAYPGYAQPAAPPHPGYVQPVQPVQPAQAVPPPQVYEAPPPAENPPGYAAAAPVSTPAYAQPVATPPVVTPVPATPPAAVPGTPNSQPEPPKRQLPDPRSFAPPPIIGNANPSRSDYIRTKEAARVNSPEVPSRDSRPDHQSRSSRSEAATPPPPPRPVHREDPEPAEVAPSLPSRPAARSPAVPASPQTDDLTERMSNASIDDNDLASQIANRRAHLRSSRPESGRSSDSVGSRSSSTVNVASKKPPPPKPSTLSKPKPPKPAHLRSAAVPAARVTDESSSPPPPVAPRPGAASTGSSRPPPPPPARSSPQPPPVGTRPSVSSRSQDDLELDSQWYAAPVDRLQLPPAFQNKNCQFNMNSRGGRTQLIVRSREPDLSVLEHTFDFSVRDPSDVTVDRRLGPKPPTPSFDELHASHERYGDKVARWSENQRGHRVGDGECWTLAAEALKHAGALPAQNYVFGAVMLSQVNSDIIASNGPMLRGDIAQFESAKFSTASRQSQTGPHHTAVITDVDNSVIHVVEQNVSGSPVQTGSYDLATMTSGRIDIYRPMSESWVEPL